MTTYGPVFPSFFFIMQSSPKAIKSFCRFFGGLATESWMTNLKEGRLAVAHETVKRNIDTLLMEHNRQMCFYAPDLFVFASDAEELTERYLKSIGIN